MEEEEGWECDEEEKFPEWVVTELTDDSTKNRPSRMHRTTLLQFLAVLYTHSI